MTWCSFTNVKHHISHIFWEMIMILLSAPCFCTSTSTSSTFTPTPTSTSRPLCVYLYLSLYLYFYLSCHLSSTITMILHGWSRAWPTLTWLAKFLGMALGSSIHNTTFPHGQVWGKMCFPLMSLVLVKKSKIYVNTYFVFCMHSNFFKGAPSKGYIYTRNWYYH